MPKYEKAPRDAVQMMNDLIEANHERLTEADVTIELLLVHGALRHHGRDVLGLARIVGERDRAKGCRDAEIQLQAARWFHDDTTDDERRAILDHELTHFLVVKKVPAVWDMKKHPDGPPEEVVLDRVGRPKLKMRPHDWEMGGFDEVAKRHGASSIEVQWADRFAFTDTGQVAFRFLDDVKMAVGAGAVARRAARDRRAQAQPKLSPVESEKTPEA